MNVREDELIAVVVDHHDNEELLLTTNKGGMKRIHKNSLAYTSRNTKGYSLFKQIKSNPHVLNRATMVSSYNSLYISDQEKLTELPVSDIPFMDVDQSFSTPLKLTERYSFVRKDMTDIADVKIIDIPSSYYQSTEEEEEQTSLFD